MVPVSCSLSQGHTLLKATRVRQDTLHMARVQLICARCVQDAPRVVPRVMVELAPDALVNMLTKAPGASISLLTQLCRQQGFDGLVGERSKPACLTFLKASFASSGGRAVYMAASQADGMCALCTAARHHVARCCWPDQRAPFL